MFNFSKLTHFSVQCPDFGLTQLIEVLNHLPNVHSLILYANTSYLSGEQIQSVNFYSNKNRIVNVTIRGRCKIQQIQVLMNLCPRIKSLEIEIEEDQLEFILRFLLLDKTMNNNHLDSSKTKCDGWQRKLLNDYSIESVLNYLYLWW
jgi:hypothetical protein